MPSLETPDRIRDERATRSVLALMLGTAAARCVFAWALGLGVDESYMIAAGRRFDWSYFDHPPLAWWLSRAATVVFDTEAAPVARLPFILLFALTTWLMYRLTARLFTPRAGFWAAVALNVSPVFGVTTASWVLPDGPLDCALVAFAFCFHRALGADRGRAAWIWWLAAGAMAGFAMLSKYSAGLVLIGAPPYLLSRAAGRRWLVRAEPWVAGLLALALFSPVVIWNAKHGWASFAFQSGRAGATAKFHPWAPLVTLGGESLFLLPWIGLALLWLFVRALLRGPREPRGWMLACLAAGPVIAFALVASWAGNRMLFHWAAPGYLMLFPVLGAWLADTGPAWPRRGLVASAVLIAVMVLAGGAQARWNWWAALVGDFAPGKDPFLEALDWTDLGPQLSARGLDGPDGPVIAGIRWHDAGKLGYALGRDRPVICLGDDPRQFGVTSPAAAQAGRDVLILAPRGTLARIRDGYGRWFEGVEEVAPFEIRHAGRPALVIPAFLARGLRVAE